MDIDKLAEKIRNIVLGELKEEFKEFRASVTGELSGFRLAVESLNSRQANVETELRDVRQSMENELRDIRRAIDDTNKRIDRLYEVVVRREEHEKVEFRLSRLEHEVAEVKAKVAV
jgi:predicted  nucleic acid-binding Zn-ribbon protein